MDSITPPKNPHAVALAQLGGRKGGLARANSMTPQQRRDLAKKAVQARWAKTTRQIKYPPDNNYKIGKLRPGEYAFFRIMQDRGVYLEYLTQSVNGLFKLHRGCYTPDFHDKLNDIYYEVSSSRQALARGLSKYIEMRRKYPKIKLMVVKPDGTKNPYPIYSSSNFSYSTISSKPSIDPNTILQVFIS